MLPTYFKGAWAQEPSNDIVTATPPYLIPSQYHVEMNNEPEACMAHMGVTKALRDVILMPEYEDL